MKRLAVLAAIMGLSAVSLADDPATQPASEATDAQSTSAAVLAAQDTERRAVQDACNAYHQAIISARQNLVNDLKTLQQQAIAQRREEDATDMQNDVDDAQGQLDGISAGWTATVLGTQDWRHVVTLPMGKYLVTATGKWSDNPGVPLMGPEGLPPGQRGSVDHEGMLVARVNGNEILVGPGAVLNLTDEENYIEMEMADSDHSDNRGSVDVIITEQPPDKQ